MADSFCQFQLEDGEVVEKKEVLKTLDKLCASPKGGTATEYMELLVYSLKMGNTIDQFMVLKALMETKQMSLLKAIAKPKNLHILSSMLIMHQKCFQMTPVLRNTLRLLQRLENCKVLRGTDLGCTHEFCTHMFSQILFKLTKHSDHEVRTLASSFQKLRFSMPNGKCIKIIFDGGLM
ncbi:hypothetical protein KC19_6G133400 [Ceratodon purpureus]|uniref:Uncharacterized protein n=1 Tax=Ceratodon purpureus TaxID=3225 RepID=A0A8T0HDZ3_CERPU|nr:hypothetical protein KC19_6G133400 [Ceratodon purpureus]